MISSLEFSQLSVLRACSAVSPPVGLPESGMAVIPSDALTIEPVGLADVVSDKTKKGDFMDLNLHFDNDAHIDDIVAFLLLQAAIGGKLRSVTVNHGNSIMGSAIETYRRLFGILGREDIRLAGGQRNVSNNFPMEWRSISDEINELELIAKTCLSSQSNNEISSLEVLRKSLREGPMRLVTTGPLTNIAEWFQTFPQDIASVYSLVMMGGALNVGGNVAVSKLSDGTAEWNFFADPTAAATVLKAGVPISVIPLDVAGQIPVSDDFLSILSRSTALHGQIAYQLWNLVYRRYNYFQWDVVAAIAAVRPELFTFEKFALAIVQEGRSQGRLVKSNDGSPCQVAVQMDKKAVIQAIMELLNKV